MKAEALVTQFQENDREYLRIRNIVEEKVYFALSNGAKLLKLAVSIVIQSIRNNPEHYISLIQDNFFDNEIQYTISSILEEKKDNKANEHTREL